MPPSEPLYQAGAFIGGGKESRVAARHVLTEQQAGGYADPQQVACSSFAHAYKVGVKNLPEGQSAI